VCVCCGCAALHATYEFAYARTGAAVCIALWCNLVQFSAVLCSMLQRAEIVARRSVLQCVEVLCSVVQCVCVCVLWTRGWMGSIFDAT